MVSLPNDSLSNRLDVFFEKLIEEAAVPISADDGPPADSLNPTIGFLDRLKLFEAGVRWVAVKNKLDTGTSDDEFGKLRRGYQRQRGARGSGADQAAPAAKRAPNGKQHNVPGLPPGS